MKEIFKKTIFAAYLAFGTIATSHAVTLNSNASGNYDDGGSHAAVYTTGWDYSLFGNSEGRSYYQFDLSSITDTITAAVLRLFQTTYYSQDPNEPIEIFDVDTDLTSLVGGTAGIPAYTDLGSGTTYTDGSFAVAKDAAELDIALNNAALSALNSASGNIALGAALTDLTRDGGSADGSRGGVDELVFVDSTNAQLILTVATTTPDPKPVPTPAIILMFSAGLICLNYFKNTAKRFSA